MLRSMAIPSVTQMHKAMKQRSLPFFFRFSDTLKNSLWALALPLTSSVRSKTALDFEMKKQP